METVEVTETFDEESIRKTWAKILAIEQEATDALLAIRIDGSEQWSEKREQLEEEQITRDYERQIQAAEEVGASTLDIEQTYQERIAQLRDNYRAHDLDLYRKAIAQKIALEQQLETNLIQIGSQLIGSLFENSKAAAIANVIISTAVAVMKTYEQLGIYASIVVPKIIAVGATELAIIGAQSLKFAEGGIVPGVDRGFDSVHALVRPGEAVLPAELTKFLVESAARGSAGGDREITIKLESDLPLLATRLSDSARSGKLTLLSNGLVSTRTRR